jgi:hypothetical protein
VVVGLAVFWIGEYFFSYSFQSCVTENTSAYSQQGAEKSDPSFFVAIEAHIRCTLRLIHHLHGVFTALFTLALAAFTWTLWRATDQIGRDTTNAANASAKNFTASERAYVKISHLPPGLSFESGDGTVFASINLEIKNHGRTPARITKVRIKSRHFLPADPMPVEADYGDAIDPNATEQFLVTGDYFYSGGTLPLDRGYYDLISRGIEILWVYGYVDYIDIFGQRHRAGYARYFDPSLDNQSRYRTEEEFLKRSNLPFVGRRGYNYDRKRIRGRKGEGEDWSSEFEET